MLKGPMLLETAFQAIKCSGRLKIVIKHIETSLNTGNFPDDSPVKPKLEAILTLWTSACSLKQIDRYLSLDQAQLNAPPLEDGINLRDASVNPSRQKSFEMERLLRKLTIAFLHLPGILELPYDPSNPQIPPQGFTNKRLIALRKLYNAARVLLKKELKVVKIDKHDDYARNLPVGTSGVNWIRTSRKNIVSALESVALLACHRPTDPTDDELLDEKIREYNQGRDKPMGEDEEREIRQVLGRYVGKSTTEQVDENFNEQGLPFLDGLMKVIDDS